MKRTFRRITATDYKVIAATLKREYQRNKWVDAVGVRSWCMDECNKLGVKWWGNENKNVIPNLVHMVMS